MAIKKRATARRAWSKDDLKQLKQLAKQGLSGTQIAKKLKRTPAATYQRATAAGVRFSSTRR